MITRKQTIEDIVASINAMKNKMHFKVMGHRDCQITHSQWLVLIMIGQHPDVGIKQISNILGITSSAATQLVDALVLGNYVARKTNTEDRRSLKLRILPKGKKSIIKIKKQQQLIMKSLFKELSDQELAMYLTLHKKILFTMVNKK